MNIILSLLSCFNAFIFDKLLTNSTLVVLAGIIASMVLNGFNGVAFEVE
jgi:hypothetical protein